MSLPRLLHRETVVVLVVTPGEPDDDGVPAATTAPVTLTGCNVQPQSTTEVRDNSLQVATSYRVSAPGLGLGLKPGSVVQWRLTTPAATWRIEGDVEEFAATRILDHTEFTITRHGG